MTQVSDGKKPVDNKARSTLTTGKAPEAAKPTDLLEAVEASSQSQSNIEKIRSILFGNQMRDYEARFARLEAQVSQESSELRADFRRRFEALEGYVRQELDALNERISGEYNERSGALHEVQKTVETLGQGLDKRVHQLDEQMNKAQRELRQHLLGQSKQLRDDMQAGISELSALVQRELQQLRSDKTDRAALAGLLTDLAARLSADS
jgi:DNA repair exonuclease SbcCD ATPase subunit